MSANPFAVAAQFAKTADIMTPTQQTFDDRFQHDLGQMALLGLGAGAAGRGLVGLYNLAKRNMQPPHSRYPAPVLTPVPMPVEEDEPPAPGLKQAVDPPRELPWYYWPTNVTAPQNLAAYRPAMAGVGLGAVYGGWKGLDYLLNHRRDQERDEELGHAKGEFEKALVGSYAKPRTDLAVGPKLAAERSIGEELGANLDALYDQAVKQANWGDMAGGAAGLYGLYALATGLGAGTLAYDRTSRGNQRAVLEKAMKQRIARAYQARPSEIVAMPQAVSVPRHPAPETESEPQLNAEMAAAYPG